MYDGSALYFSWHQWGVSRKGGGGSQQIDTWEILKFWINYESSRYPFSGNRRSFIVGPRSKAQDGAGMNAFHISHFIMHPNHVIHHFFRDCRGYRLFGMDFLQTSNGTFNKLATVFLWHGLVFAFYINAIFILRFVFLLDRWNSFGWVI